MELPFNGAKGRAESERRLRAVALFSYLGSMDRAIGRPHLGQLRSRWIFGNKQDEHQSNYAVQVH